MCDEIILEKGYMLHETSNDLYITNQYKRDDTERFFRLAKILKDDDELGRIRIC